MGEKSPRRKVEGRQVLTAGGKACFGRPHLAVDPTAVSGSFVDRGLQGKAGGPGSRVGPVVRICRVSSVKGAGQGAPITGLSHVQLLVSDVGESARWYAAALGLVPFAEDLDVGYVALQHRASRIVVVLTHGARTGDRTSERVGFLDHLAFAVPDGDSLAAGFASDRGRDHPRGSRPGERPPLASAPRSRWQRH